MNAHYKFYIYLSIYNSSKILVGRCKIFSCVGDVSCICRSIRRTSTAFGKTSPRICDMLNCWTEVVASLCLMKRSGLGSLCERHSDVKYGNIFVCCCPPLTWSFPGLSKHGRHVSCSWSRASLCRLDSCMIEYDISVAI